MPRTPSYRDIFSLHSQYVEYLLQKSHFVNQYVKNIHLSGISIEDEMRGFLSNVLPDRFRIAHGYIVFAKSKNHNPIISQQLDVVIVDSLVPNRIFSLDKQGGAEIIPLESVVGIFEVKRTLRKATLEDAVSKLQCNLAELNLTCKDSARVLPGGVGVGKQLEGGYYTNPIVGIIGLDHENEIENKMPKMIDPITMIFSMNGFLHALGNEQTGNFWAAPEFPMKPYYITRKSTQDKRVKNIANGLGIILAHLSGCSGRKINPEFYFFNDHV